MAAPSVPPSGLKPWLRIVFGLSLALNLLVVGLVVGGMVRHGFPRGHHSPTPTGVSLMRALPSENREAIREHLRATLPPSADRVAEARTLARALETDPYDPAVLDAVIDEQAARRAAFQAALKESWTRQVTEMDSTARQAYADRLIKLAEEGGRQKWKSDKDD